MRAVSAISRAKIRPRKNPIGKLVAGAMMQDIAIYALDLQAQGGVVNDPALADFQARFQAMLLRSPATCIEGGSDQILRNIIAERVLGLPPDVRVDKDVPFNRF